MVEKRGTKRTISIDNSNVKIAAIIAIAFVIGLIIGGFLLGGITGGVITMSPQDAANKAIKFINENLVQPGTEVSFVSVKEFNSFYNITMSYQNREISILMTKDGSYLVPGIISLAETQTQQQTQVKTDKPEVQLFVMSFCPYGMQAENAMRNVVNLLGNKADIKVHFIASVSGTAPYTFQSLHGDQEVQEDLRQVCIMKNYDQKTYWNYLMNINANCSSKYKDSVAYDACWKDAATKAGIDTSKVDTCSKGTEGQNLLKADADLATANGVSSSPTLIINGVAYNGDRNTNAYKEAICNAFSTTPSECSQELSNTTTTAGGSCGS